LATGRRVLAAEPVGEVDTRDGLASAIAAMTSSNWLTSLRTRTCLPNSW
jgi:hypothetical protein